MNFDVISDIVHCSSHFVYNFALRTQFHIFDIISKAFNKPKSFRIKTYLIVQIQIITEYNPIKVLNLMIVKPK